MTSDETSNVGGRGARFVFTAAAIVVVVAGLKAAGSLLVPILIALLLALLCARPAKRLRDWGVPGALAILLVVLGVFAALVGLSAVVSSSVSTFADSIDVYEKKIDERFAGLNEHLADMGLDTDEEGFGGQVDSKALLKFIATTAQDLLGALSNLVLILLVMVFMLAEAAGLPKKIRQALGNPDADMEIYERVTGQIHSYLHVKTAISFATGVLVAILAAALDVDLPLLWGLLAFVFNYIPNIGSIIAAVPAVLLAWVLHGEGTAALMGLGIIAINMVLGNVIEPRLMGRRLGLSPLVVILSMIFWGWLWGPVGMLLSVPLTMVVKILLEQSDDYRFAAVLLGSGDVPEDDKA